MRYILITILTACLLSACSSPDSRADIAELVGEIVIREEPINFYVCEYMVIKKHNNGRLAIIRISGNSISHVWETKKWKVVKEAE